MYAYNTHMITMCMCEVPIYYAVRGVLKRQPKLAMCATAVLTCCNDGAVYARGPPS